MQKITIIGIEDFPIIKDGDDLANIIVQVTKNQNIPIENRDIVVIAQKIVSKAEGRIRQIKYVKPSKKAKAISKIIPRSPELIELVLNETKNIMKVSKEILVIKNKQDLICINSGIDKSNVQGEDSYTLLPADSDQSAEKIRTQIMKLTGKKVAVIICDTYSRPFRRGQVEFAIGVVGINPFIDYKGKKDLFDYVLRLKNIAIADELACAAELVMGQGAEGIPVAIIKNFQRGIFNGKYSAKELNISREEDLFKGIL